jgi:hypothetical protein
MRKRRQILHEQVGYKTGGRYRFLDRLCSRPPKSLFLFALRSIGRGIDNRFTELSEIELQDFCTFLNVMRIPGSQIIVSNP